MHILFAVLLAALPAPQGNARPAVNPRSIAQTLYADHFAHDMRFSSKSTSRKKKWLTADLYNHIDTYFHRKRPKDEVPNINGDPFTNTQEYPKEFSVGPSSEGPGTATVSIVMTVGSRQRSVELRLVRGPTGWLVDDLVYEDGTTFRKLLDERP